jgi:hypothetical protein
MVEMRYNTRVNHIKSDGLFQQPRHPFSTYVRGIDTMTNHTPFVPENLNDYAPWVATYGLRAPYGKCQCGCGNDSPISNVTRRSSGYLKGQPIRYATPGHTQSKRFLLLVSQPNRVLRNHHYNVRPSLDERFWPKVDKRTPDECWEWKGSRNGRGYGKFGVQGHSRYAHRISYEISNGPIPEGMLVCHTCDNPSCVNPSHLFPGTPLLNVHDMVQKGRHRRANFEGKRRPNSKFTDEQVIEMRRRYRDGVSQASMAREFGVRKNTINSIITGKTYSHIANPVAKERYEDKL